MKKDLIFPGRKRGFNDNSNSVGNSSNNNNSKNDTNEMDVTEFSNNKAFLHYGGSERTVNGTKRASKKGLSTTVTEAVTGDTPTGKHNIPILTKHSFNNPSTKFGILAIKSSTTKMAKP
eukprot:CAMPEP_0170778918 /NCGR_PEP_ID=MMETSP0733-20121128/12674_1 /TAXON_ID=186038 /ORGANISM="Fragilariopsis kerguelensis, Strain L26-C5" /LENGTH=118 /DNA_ID=CAMNT_0011122427 /DNA_START=128 /DNA_END=481 /DNA_ORIENTATION=-